MGFLDKLKAMFGGKKPQVTALGAVERQVEALEAKFFITEHAKRIEGGVEGFDMAADEVAAMLPERSGDKPGFEAVDLLHRRVDLARQVAHFLREVDLQKKIQLGKKFLADFREVRERIPFRTRTKYERIRIDVESGRMR